MVNVAFKSPDFTVDIYVLWVVQKLCKLERGETRHEVVWVTLITAQVGSLTWRLVIKLAQDFCYLATKQQAARMGSNQHFSCKVSASGTTSPKYVFFALYIYNYYYVDNYYYYVG